MKKIKRSSLCALFVLCSLYANAYDFETRNDDGVHIWYNIVSSDELTCEVTYQNTSYNSYSGSVTIPETVETSSKTYIVVGIGEKAFFKCANLTDVTIPNSVTTIGNDAFEQCHSLTSVTLGNGVKTIGSNAFYSCETLTKFEVAEDNQYYCDVDGVLFTKDMTTLIQFPTCSPLLPSYDIPNSVLTIEDYAFYECEGLTSLTLGNSVKTIGDFAFCNCIYLAGELRIPDSVQTIGDYAFANCSELTSVIIGKNVTSIGEYAFDSCIGITGELTIPSSVTTIGAGAFFYFGSKVVTIEDSDVPIIVTSKTIYESVFNGSPVEKLYLGRTMEYEKDCSPFLYRTALNSLTIGNKVTSIGRYEFYYCSSLTEVSIPSSVTFIDEGAFNECTSLTNVTLEDGEETLSMTTSSSYTPFTTCPIETLYLGRNLSYSSSYLPFRENTTLSSLTIGDKVTTINSYEFYSCSSLMGELKIPDSVTTIGSNSFSSCSGLTSIIIGKGVSTIGNSTFYRCTGLTSVIYNVINCTSAGSSSNPIFSGCTHLSEATIGENVEYMPKYLFYDCTNITKITSLNPTPPKMEETTFDDIDVGIETPIDCLIKYALADSWSDFSVIYAEEDGDLYYPVPISCVGAAIVTITGGDENGAVLKKGDIAVITPINGAGINGVVYHVIEDLTDEINDNGSVSFDVSEYHRENRIYSFSRDDSSTYDITVSDAGQVLEQITVANINSVQYLKVHGDINGTDILTIRRMTNLQVLDLSEANVVSGGDSYYEDTYRTARNVVGSYFFVDMTSLIMVKLPNSATSIGQYVCGNCTRLTSINIPNNVSYIDTYAFAGCKNLTYLTIEESSQSLKIYTDKSNNASPFADCPLEIVSLGRTLTYDYSGKYTLLYDKNSVVSLTIGEAVTSINDYEFYNCSGIVKDVTIPDNVTTIGDYAFYGCTKLPGVAIGDGVTYIGSYAFADCGSMITLTLGSGVETIKEHAFYECRSITSLKLGNNVSFIGGRAFSYCSSMTGELKIPDSVTSIGDYAFSSCAFTTISIGSGITSLNDHEFYNCSKLTTLNIGSGVTSIGEYAFRYCTALTELYIPSNVISMTDNAFYNCSSLNQLVIEDSTEELSISSNVFGMCSLEMLSIGRDISYKSNSSPFMNNTTITSVWTSDNVNTIGAYEFSGCTALAEVVISNNVAEIQKYSFENCSKLSSLTIGNQVTSIGDYAFYGCEGLTEVKTPNSIKTIGSYAFSNCTRLTSLTLGSSCSSVDSNAFSGCTALEELYSKNPSTPSITGDTFDGVDKQTCVLYVPTGSLNVYWLHTYWTEFFNIKEMYFDPNDDTDGIEGVNSIVEQDIVGYYGIDGRQLNAPQHGINILRYSDGTTKKVLVK